MIEAHFPLRQVLNENGEIVSRPPVLSREEQVRLYRSMLRIRLIDERMMMLQRQGRVGFYGACTGQEAAVVGSAAAFRPEDWIFPGLREGGAALMRGFPLLDYVSQVLGNRIDPTKGRQMPCHYSAPAANYVSWSSCIATQLPHAVGAALAMKKRKTAAIAIAYFGDGATSEGDFNVAMNFAGVYKAPVLFFCQNNQWAISVPMDHQTAAETFAVKAVAYGLKSLRVDGNDVLAVFRETQAAVDEVRGGGGPILIEAVTYRMGAHSSSDDPSRYRDESVTEQWKARDPLIRYRRYLRGLGLWNDELERLATHEMQEELAATIQSAEAAGEPSVQTLFEDVYSRKPWHLVVQEREG
ncbi:MAG TPA: thiamine pyrophosphate-dependent dehydrogenase E1 component subunit alpha [Acidobacteriota bacterium]|jgi:pyruvate dehydrogenase E1 component alpha subunit/2-oxoisovalerate dehydrogenase E1 component alpha subunit